MGFKDEQMNINYWNIIFDFFRDEFKNDFELWLKPIKLYSFEGNLITLSVPNEIFLENFTEKHLEKTLNFVRNTFDNKSIKIKLIIEEESQNTNINHSEKNIRDCIEQNRDSNSVNLNFLSGLNPNYTLKNFVVGPCNEFACAAAKKIIQSPGTDYNPLFIYGGVGLGKTHLEQGIGQAIHSRHLGYSVVYSTCEHFTNDFIVAIQKKTTSSFRLKYRNADVLMIDDIQFLETKESTQKELFHTFEKLRDSGKQMIFTSDRSPSELQEIMDRLVSRFSSGLVVEIEPPDERTRAAIVRTKLDFHKLSVSDDIIQYLTENTSTSIRNIEACVTKLKLLHEIYPKDLTLDRVRSSLKDVIDPSIEVKELDIMRILDEVAQYYNLSNGEIISKTRNSKITQARQLAMYLSRKFTKLTNKEIGRYFGGKKHSTVIFACDKIQNELKSNPSIKTIYDAVYKNLAS